MREEKGVVLGPVEVMVALWKEARVNAAVPQIIE